MKLVDILTQPIDPDWEDKPQPSPGMRYPFSGHIKCKDGSMISVQCNHDAYCTPKNDTGPWTHVECGYPKQPIPGSWAAYENGGVYAYLPVYLLEEYIALHGGELNP